MLRRPSWMILTCILLLLGYSLSSCISVMEDTSPLSPKPATETAAIGDSSGNPIIPSPSLEPQKFPVSIPFGPDREDFPPSINPLTGIPVSDASLLDLPALLISITHFPPQARPQAGLSFAPWVFEYLISIGSTRFLAVFYGEFPNQATAVSSSCEIRNEPFVRSGLVLGNRVWLDTDMDGNQETGEPGLGGVCVSLFDSNGMPVDKTTTDSNGFFGFNVEANEKYLLEFNPGALTFTVPNIGFEDLDSDVDPATGRSEVIMTGQDDLFMDAGLVPSKVPYTLQSGLSPSGIVGPVRSARLVNIHIQNFFQDSCLIYAGSTREIRDRIPGCAEVFQKGDGGVGSMLDIARMVNIAEDNFRKRKGNFDYANNVFDPHVPTGGQPVQQLDVYVAELNQSAWLYDPSIPGWLRYVDDADKDKIGILHPDTDRLTDRQIYFENLIILYVEHEVLAPAIIDMYLQQGESGSGLIFRDGQMFDMKWSTIAGEYEQQTGLRRPIAFLDSVGKPFPLHPGRTWIIIATPFSFIDQKSPGHYRMRILAPEGAGVY